MENDNRKFKTVATFQDVMSAQITAGMLNENGIPAGVFGADSSFSALSYMKPVEVKVNEEDYDEAMRLIAGS